jgi:hypothetical protein
MNADEREVTEPRGLSAGDDEYAEPDPNEPATPEPEPPGLEQSGLEPSPPEEGGGAGGAAPPAPPQTEDPGPPAYRPAAPTFQANALTDEERRSLASRMLDDPLGVVEELVERRLTERDRAEGVVNFHLEAARERNPEFFRTHGGMVRQALAGMPPRQRASREALDGAILAAIYQEGQATGDIWEAIRRAAAQAGNATPLPPASGGSNPARSTTPASAAAPRPAAPPTARTPAGGSTHPGAGARSARPQSTSVADRLAAAFGKAGARQILEAND